MRAHGLKAIDTLLESTAILIRSTELKDPSHKSLVDIIATRIRGVISKAPFPALRP
jgi:ATP phosphoribosyltransferase